MSWKLRVLAMIASLGSCGALAADVDPEEPVDTSKSFALTVTDVVLQNHIDPPTRQQMVLEGVKRLYRVGKEPVPRGLSSRISVLSSPGEIAAYLDTVRAEFDHLGNTEDILIQGMLQSAPGGTWLVKAKVSKVQEQLAANRYVGTGVALSMNKDPQVPAVTKTFLNGPAWQAGVRAHDLIVEIDGQATAGQGMNQIVTWLRGAAGSQVTVVVRQPAEEEGRKLTITRGRVFIPTVLGHHEVSEGEWEYTIDTAEDIALLRITSVGPSTLHELRQIEARLREKDVRGIVLDLRSGGGILHDLVMVADALLDGGVIGHVRSLQSSKTYEARPGALFQRLPMAVLITESANADRVFLTAALQDLGRAVVVGEPTSGETYVAQLLPVPGNDAKIRMPVAIMQRGDGTTLLRSPSRSRQVDAELMQKLKATKQRPGFIMPDHVVASKGRFSGHVQTQKEPADDPLVAKAIEVLRAAAQAPSGG